MFNQLQVLTTEAYYILRELCTLRTITCPWVSISYSQPHSDWELEINDLQNYHNQCPVFICCVRKLFALNL